MWRSADGRVNIAKLPCAVDELSGLRAFLSTLSPEVWKSLDEKLDEFTEALYYELDEIPIDEAAEAQFVGEALPPEFASNLDWGRLLGEDCSAELARIDLRWRMDVSEAVMSMITDLENGPTAE